MSVEQTRAMSSCGTVGILMAVLLSGCATLRSMPKAGPAPPTPVRTRPLRNPPAQSSLERSPERPLRPSPTPGATVPAPPTSAPAAPTPTAPAEPRPPEPQAAAPNGSPKRAKAESLRSEAADLLSKGRKDEALARLRDARLVDPGDAAVVQDLAKVMATPPAAKP